MKSSLGVELLLGICNNKIGITYYHTILISDVCVFSMHKETRGIICCDFLFSFENLSERINWSDVHCKKKKKKTVENA